MGFPRWKYNPSTAGIAYLHLTLLGSLITLILAIYLFAHGGNDSTLVPCAVLLLLGSLASFAYVLFHEYHAHKRIHLVKTKVGFSTIRRPVYLATRLSIALAMLWLLSSGWNMIIAARQPVCIASTPLLTAAMPKPWQTGGACKAQRASAAFSIINLLTACAFFTHMATTRDPFDIHLLGKFKARPVTLTPYRFSRQSKDSFTNRLSHEPSASSDGSWNEKPLPKTPSTKSRPPTPRPVSPPSGPIGLGISTPTHVPTKTPTQSPSRPQSVHSSLRAPSIYNHSPPLYWQQNDSTKDLKGFMPMKELRRPPPTASADSAWRALHPPASHFRHVSGSSPTLRPATAHGLSSISWTVPTSPLLGSQASRSPSMSSFGQARGHKRNKSAPYTPILIPSHIDPPSRSTSSISSPRKRGHVRCTSDPNEMISGALAAEMDLATRLDRKLQEVSQKLDSQRFADKSESSGSQVTSSGGVTGGAGMSESGKSSSSTAETDTSLHTANSTTRKKFTGMDGKFFAKMEWDVLMGKDVIV